MNKLLIIDEQNNYRKGVKHLLEITFPNFMIETASLLSKSSLKNPPDLMLVEPNSDFEEFLSLIDEFIAKGTSIIVLSPPEREHKRALELLKRNIRGYLLKNMRTNDLLSCIQVILNGHRYIHPQIANVLLDDYQESFSKFHNTRSKQLSL